MRDNSIAIIFVALATIANSIAITYHILNGATP